MTNKEFYKEKIFEMACKGKRMAVQDNSLTYCGKTCCINCDLYDTNEEMNCAEMFGKWLEKEYIEPKVDWSKIPVDAKILVRDDVSSCWYKRYFAKYENGKVYAFDNGTASWSAKTIDGVRRWNFAKLAKED